MKGKIKAKLVAEALPAIGSVVLVVASNNPDLALYYANIPAIATAASTFVLTSGVAYKFRKHIGEKCNGIATKKAVFTYLAIGVTVVATIAAGVYLGSPAINWSPEGIALAMGAGTSAAMALTTLVSDGLPNKPEEATQKKSTKKKKKQSNSNYNPRDVRDGRNQSYDRDQRAQTNKDEQVRSQLQGTRPDRDRHGQASGDDASKVVDTNPDGASFEERMRQYRTDQIAASLMARK